MYDVQERKKKSISNTVETEPNKELMMKYFGSLERDSDGEVIGFQETSNSQSGKSESRKKSQKVKKFKKAKLSHGD